MKLVTYSEAGEAPRIGALAGETVVDLSRLAPDMRTLFELGEPAMERAREAAEAAESDLALADVELHAPIVPRKLFHTAGNFREHEEESKRVDFSHPIPPWIVFFQNVDAIIGPDDPVVYPSHLTRELDYELELAVVLSKSGKHFSPEDAEDYIGGYTIFNDITARDIQRREMNAGIFSFCKAIDTFCPLGPWIVTPDEVPNPHDLKMLLRVNGEVRQDSDSSRMDFTIAEILSSYSPLGYSAGDVLSTGTVSGIAGFSEDPEAWYLKPGDVIEAEIERIGVLRNPVVSWPDAHGSLVPPPVPTGAT
jgi:2-keto-4-pentenoate hydratase/2-oxohepta-3-ene-1,7-dioic acid hydratase in catechol pathway